MTSTRSATILVFLGLMSLPRHALCDEPHTPPPDAPPRLAPEKARGALEVAKGLDFQLVAHEPMVRQPLSITFDDRGRLWVLQYLQYPIPNGLKPVEVDQYLRTKYDRVPEPPPGGAERRRPDRDPR